MADYNLKKNLSRLQAKPFNFILIQGSKGSMLLVEPRRIPPKLVEQFKKELAGRAIAKGVCTREEGQLVFATRVPPVASWKRMIKEVFVQQKCNTVAVELRQLAENESEEVESGEEEGTQESGTQEPDATVPTAPPVPPSTPGADAGKIQMDRFAALTRKIAGAGLTDAAVKKQLVTLLTEAKQLAAGRKFDELKGCLDDIEDISNGTGKVEKGGRPGMIDTGAIRGKVQFEKISLDWNSSKQTVGVRLKTLHQAILSEFNDDEGNTAAKKLEKVLARFNEGLGNTLDKLRNAQTPTDQKTLAAQSAAITDRYLKYLNDDPLVQHLDANPFNIELKINEVLSGPLKQLKQQLQQI